MAAQLMFIKLHPKKNAKCLAQCPLVRLNQKGKKGKRLVIMHITTTFDENIMAYQHKHLIPTVKHGGGGLMI